MSANKDYIFTIEREKTFTFSGFDNKSRPVENQMRAIIRNLSAMDQQTLLAEQMDDIEIVDGKAKINPKTGLKTAFTVENFRVKELQNIFYIDGETEIEVKTFSDLASIPAEWAMELMNELRLFLVSTEVPEKNS